MADTPDRPTVLLVDDDWRSREVLAAYLARDHTVLEAEGAREALAILEGGAVDLVLLDVMMPGMNGYDACRAIKAGREVLLPVILLTALDDQEARNTGLAAGADDFITKPVDRTELLLRVRAFVRLRRQEQLIREQLEEVRRLERTKDELTAFLLHDVRNPLSAVSSYLQLVRRFTLRHDWQHAVEAVDATVCSAQRLDELLHDVLEVRRLEERGATIRREPIDVLQLVTVAAGGLEGLARTSKVRLEVQPGEPAVASLDVRLVRRAVENVVVNAITHSPDDGVVSLLVRRTADGVAVEVGDRGPGVPDAFKRRIFDKFGTVEAARAKSRRSHGLGLYFVRLATLEHEGDAEVLDREGGGALFRLLFRDPRPEVGFVT